MEPDAAEVTPCPECGKDVDSAIMNWHRASRHGLTYLPEDE